MTIKAQTGLSKRRDGEGKPIGPLVTGREYQQERCVTGEECLPTGAAPCAPGGGKMQYVSFSHLPLFGI